MQSELIFPSGLFSALNNHLFGEGDLEQLAFLLAGVASGRRWLRLLVREVIPVPAEALERQTPVSLAVKPAFVQTVLQRCNTEGLSLIEAHSHPFADRQVTFSSTDLANEAEKFRYLSRKIPSIRHGTLVAGKESLDAHLWDRGRGRAEPFERVRVLGSPVRDLLPSSTQPVDVEKLPVEEWLDRQVLALGVEGQRRLEAVRVGVVGCGGTGSVVVQLLAHLGVRQLVCVDPDWVELTNLNRLVGAVRADVDRRRFKVQVARHMVKRINPKSRVIALPLPLKDSRAIASLKGVDMLFGCTDNHGSRLLLNQLAVQYLIPYLDLGAGLLAEGGGHLMGGGGQLRLVLPGEFCLGCIDGLDRVRAAQDVLPALSRERQSARGYIVEDDQPTPAILFLNSLLASLAVAEFVNLWTGFRPPVPLLYYDLLGSRLTPARAEQQSSCLVCGEGGSLAYGDLQCLPIGGENGLPGNIPLSPTLAREVEEMER